MREVQVNALPKTVRPSDNPAEPAKKARRDIGCIEAAVSLGISTDSILDSSGSSDGSVEWDFSVGDMRNAAA